VLSTKDGLKLVAAPGWWSLSSNASPADPVTISDTAGDVDGAVSRRIGGGMNTAVSECVPCVSIELIKMAEPQTTGATG
jgi:hypothetical protein